MIYDCFMFFNELDLLEIRLHEMSKVADRFVIVESGFTHTGNRKPFHYLDNIDRFSEFSDRIIHVNADNWVSHLKHAPHRESEQRNAIADGLRECQDDDIIIITDLDEIPRATSVPRSIRHGEFFGLRMRQYDLYLNRCRVNTTWSPVGAVRYSTLSNVAPSEVRSKTYNGTDTVNFISDAGWHFSWMGGADRVKTKISSFMHNDILDQPPYNTKEYIEAISGSGKDFMSGTPFGGNGDYSFVEIDNTFPDYLVDNQDKFGHMIKR